MKLRSLLSLGITGVSLVAALVDPTSAHAQDKTLAPAAFARLAAPVPLEPGQRTIKLGAALKAIGATQSAPQTLEIRLTPIAPRAGGATIARAGAVIFNGADADEPDGSFSLVRGNGIVALSSVEMKIPTEKGKLYVVDCRVRAAQGAGTKFTLTRGVTSSVVPVEDGHIVSAFSATATTSPLIVSAAPGPSDSGSVLGYFYGCDVGKAS